MDPSLDLTPTSSTIDIAAALDHPTPNTIDIEPPINHQLSAAPPNETTPDHPVTNESNVTPMETTTTATCSVPNEPVMSINKENTVTSESNTTAINVEKVDKPVVAARPVSPIIQVHSGPPPKRNVALKNTSGIAFSRAALGPSSLNKPNLTASKPPPPPPTPQTENTLKEVIL